MHLEQSCWSAAAGWTPAAPSPNGLGRAAQLVLVFGSRASLTPGVLAEIRRAYPSGYITGCSTAGEICDTRVRDDSVVVVAIEFERTPLKVATVCLSEAPSIEGAGAILGERLAADDLRHVLVFSDGLLVNGSELVRGLSQRLPRGVSVTGGLAADGTKFEQTAVVVDGELHDRQIVGVGLRGGSIRVGYGSVGGWDSFGPWRAITKASGNVLYELDGQPALGLYRKYLGDTFRDVPGAWLHFPLSIRKEPEGRAVVRTILSVNEAEQSIRFAGDITQGAQARLMRVNMDRLVEGAAGAGKISADAAPGHPAELALLISCVGRKVVLNQRVEEEVEAVRESVGPAAVIVGFYSYGEISPFEPGGRCELHNQTMTVVTFSES